MRDHSASLMIARATGIASGGSSATPGGYAPGRMARAGFTLVEMFVVIAIILIIVALAVPGVNAMVYSSNRALAENSLRVGVNAARDAAIASSRSGDGAAVFLYEPGSGVRIVPAEVVGQLEDPVKTGVTSVGGGGNFGQQSQSATQPKVVRDILAPIALGQSVTLPESWMVRGYAAPGSMLNSGALSPGTSNAGDLHQWYRTRNYSDSAAAVDEGNWVFPESGFYDIDEPVASTPDIRRHSFMVRFSARTGSVSRVDREALLIDPRPSVEERDQLISNRTDPDAWKRVDWAEDTRKWAVRTLGRGQSEQFEAEVLSNNSNDTVLVKSVNRLALYDERRLARGLGGRLNQDTGTIYETYAANDRISFDQSLFGGASIDQLRRNINAWINGDTNGGAGGPTGDIFDGVIDEDDTPESALFTLQGYTGELTEIEQ